MEIDGETVETVSDFIFLGSKITADGDCSHEIKRHVLLGRKVMANLDSMLKIRDIILPTKVHLVSSVQFSSVAQSCPTLYDPMDCSLPGSSVHGIFQARILEWIACPPPGDRPDPGIKPPSLTSLALASGFFTTSTTY